jgi:hypothetical protein
LRLRARDHSPAAGIPTLRWALDLDVSLAGFALGKERIKLLPRKVCGYDGEAPDRGGRAIDLALVIRRRR